MRNMNKWIILGFLLFALWSQTKAQHENIAFGAGPGAMCGISVISTDVWAAANNQANLSQIDVVSAGVYYENRYFLKELGYRALAGSLPTKTGTFGLTVSQFGYSEYMESRFGLGYGMAFGKNFSGGIQLNYLNTKLGDIYGSRSAVVAEGGLSAKLSDDVTFGVHLFNFNRARVSEWTDERIPVVFRAGIAYVYEKQLTVGVEVIKDINFAPVLGVGFEYLFNDFLYLRAGINVRPSLSGFGFGLKLKNLRIDIANTMHPVLGNSPRISLIYQLNKKN